MAVIDSTGSYADKASRAGSQTFPVFQSFKEAVMYSLLPGVQAGFRQARTRLMKAKTRQTQELSLPKRSCIRELSLPKKSPVRSNIF